MNNIMSILRYKGNQFALATFSLLITVLPEGFFKCGIVYCPWSEIACVIVNRVLFGIVVFAVVNIVYHCYRKFRNSVSISDRTYSIKIEYADLLEIEEGKKVISFDECFTTKVGDRTEDVKPGSICGQYLAKHPIKDMDALKKAVDAKPIGKSKCKDWPCYKPGTIIPREGFMLMAFTELNEFGRSDMTYVQYLDCLNTLWAEIDRYRGTDDVYLPILGSRIVNFDKVFTQQELLDIMIYSYRLSPYKLRLPSVLHIVCKECQGFSIDKVYGID